jgi:hypothetical protein
MNLRAPKFVEMEAENSTNPPVCEVPMRKLERYIAQYGPEIGPKMFHLLQSQAGHASVSARLRRKIAVLTGAPIASPAKEPAGEELPLFRAISAPSDATMASVASEMPASH